MKPLIEKLTLAENNSFVARTYRTPLFEVPWHQHIEYELILFTEGEGKSFIGNYIGEFQTDDVFLLGSNLPHTFQKAQSNLITSAVVVQFKEDFWGPAFLLLPECRDIYRLLQLSAGGLKIRSECRERLAPLIRELEYLTGFSRIIRLCECLELIAQREEYEILSTQEIKEQDIKSKERLDAIFHFTHQNFHAPIQLTDVAKLVNMSVPAFCSYFRRSTKKTYVGYLNEIRIGHACKLLKDTHQHVAAICYESGFSTLANFNNRFLIVTGTTPSQYRKKFSMAADSNSAVQQINRTTSIA
ncbi:AraC family transcriptional regulator [Chitinophaga sp. RAB17]|uniref:AraC family transcriptional regulator n=1 Tax=Chitinophaga sp. RAB17 TaxID=3233049 RepID=UPI003F8E6C48